MNLNDFGDSMTFNLAPSVGKSFVLFSKTSFRQPISQWLPSTTWAAIERMYVPRLLHYTTILHWFRLT